MYPLARSKTIFLETKKFKEDAAFTQKLSLFNAFNLWNPKIAYLKLSFVAIFDAEQIMIKE